MVSAECIVLSGTPHEKAARTPLRVTRRKQRVAYVDMR